MTMSKENALYELADDLSLVESNANNAHFILNELFERFFSEDFDGSIESAQHIAHRYEWAQKCVNILLDYDMSVRKTLSDMVADASKSKDAE